MPRINSPSVCQIRPLSRKNCHFPSCPRVRFHQAASPQESPAYRNSREGPAAGESGRNQPEEWGQPSAIPARASASMTLTGCIRHSRHRMTRKGVLRLYSRTSANPRTPKMVRMSPS